MDSEENRLLTNLVEAMIAGDKKEIDRLKYDNLFYGSNLFSIITNYIALSKVGIDFNFGFRTIKKGTKLYRIRGFKEGTDYSDENQWSYPPKMPENRANRKGEPALYLGTTENICVLETHIGKEEKYVLGEYEVIEDIKLGGFLDCEDRHNIREYLAGVILNAFLIAPSRGEKNKELFEFLDEYYKKGLSLNDLNVSDAKKIDLPLKFGFINKREEFYKITNNLLEPIKAKYPEGINYSSCYIPASTVGIICSDSNIVLYKEGMSKVSFIKHSVKTNKLTFTGLDVIKVLLNVSPDGNK